MNMNQFYLSQLKFNDFQNKLTTTTEATTEAILVHIKCYVAFVQM